MKRPDVPHTVYLHRDNDGNTIYVGATSHLRNRTYAHKRQSPWWPEVACVVTDSEHPDYQSAHARERFLIATLEPRCNTKHNPRGNETERAWQLAQAEAGGSVPSAMRGYMIAAAMLTGDPAVAVALAER